MEHRAVGRIACSRPSHNEVVANRCFCVAESSSLVDNVVARTAQRHLELVVVVHRYAFDRLEVVEAEINVSVFVQANLEVGSGLYQESVPSVNLISDRFPLYDKLAVRSRSYCLV